MSSPCSKAHAPRPDASPSDREREDSPRRKTWRGGGAKRAGGTYSTSTYVMRKKEKAALLDELQDLRRDLMRLKEREAKWRQERAKAIVNVFAGSGALHQELATSLMRDAIRAQELSIAHAQSALSGYASTLEHVPHEMTLCLSADPDQRRETLVSLKHRKIRMALAYMSARTQFLDPFRPFSETSRYLLDNGDYCCLRIDRTVLDAASVSVRQVYDALRSWLCDAEMLVTDELGDITTRDETVYDDVDIQHNHYVSELSNGAPVEFNVVTNFDFMEHDEYADGGPLGVLTEDFVDRDDLFPYHPSECVRHDVTSVITARAHSRIRRNPGTNQDEKETAVALTRACLLKLHRPLIPLPPGVEHKLRENITQWADVMLSSVLEQVNRMHLR